LAYLGVGEPRGEFTQGTGQLVVGPRSRFLSHAGGFVPYASHRMAAAIMGDTGRSPVDSLDDFAGFYFDRTVVVAAGKLFAPGLETYSGMDTPARDAIEATNALALFPRLGTAPAPAPPSAVDRVRHFVSRCAMRAVSRLIST
jgi:6-methylsalicylate decarboxylase